ncbi:HAD family hydrolase [Tengunoibacter tsumagoiensis]|uniref:Phosphoglycolate phosphatase n=1 Tax=Tengunoibacter tsumagoiensis TaxID=2014871 RepID=A0A401ZUV0_9CHLR|nr:HAD family hydrolase [Tengunoibacter tsumagoiensis]GCE10689.1 phosphoglycolate phosphatase [Tengunoibacter tsumagoiensis]
MNALSVVPSNYQTILFDLDGTLTDPKSGITRSVQYALAKMGIIEPDLEALVPFIGPPLTESLKLFYHMTDEQAELGVTYYREYFADRGIFDNAVFPGIPTLLQALKDEGKLLLVATSKPTPFAEQILTHFDLDQYFTHVVGSNMDGTRVDKTEVIAHALSLISDDTDEPIVMIGDRKHDIIGAHGNLIDSIAILHGYGPLEELQAANPTHIVTDVEALSNLLLAPGKVALS